MVFQELFTALGSSQETALPPDALRKALAQSFYDQRRFQLGFMDDAAECFVRLIIIILTREEKKATNVLSLYRKTYYYEYTIT